MHPIAGTYIYRDGNRSRLYLILGRRRDHLVVYCEEGDYRYALIEDNSDWQPLSDGELIDRTRYHRITIGGKFVSKERGLHYDGHDAAIAYVAREDALDRLIRCRRRILDVLQAIRAAVDSDLDQSTWKRGLLHDYAERASDLKELTTGRTILDREIAELGEVILDVTSRFPQTRLPDLNSLPLLP